MKVLGNFPSSFRTEVHQDVAAEDHVHCISATGGGGISVLREVQVGKGYAFTNMRQYLELPIFSLLEVTRSIQKRV